MGLTPRGQGARAIQEGWTQKDGKLPVNPSGGLKAKGHPVGISLGHSNDPNTTWRGLLWSFGASEQDEAGKKIRLVS